FVFLFFFQAEDGIRDFHVTGVQTCALPIFLSIALDQEKRLDAVEKVLQNAGVLCEIASRMDSGPLPQSTRDDAVADRPQPVALRSEERRVGKECRYRWSLHGEKIRK